MPKKKPSPAAKSAISQYLAQIGKKGGQVKGPSKARDPDKMREAQKRSVESRKNKKPGSAES
jgi:general stress protein YciG